MANRALLTGLAFYNTDGIRDLPGVINDLNLIESLLKNDFGFSIDAKVVDSGAHKHGVLEALSTFVNSGMPGDYLLWYHSGHGSHRYNPDEKDQFTELLITYEHDWSNCLNDHEIQAVLEQVDPGVQLTAVVDACHSEGVGDTKDVDTPWTMTKYVPPPDHDQIQFGREALQLNAASVGAGVKDVERDYSPAAVKTEESFPDYAMITSAKYDEKAKMDVFSVDGQGSKMLSVFTYELFNQLKKNPKIDLGELAWSISRFSKGWGHVATLRGKPHHAKTQFANGIAEKSLEFSGQAYVDIPPRLQGDPAVEGFLHALSEDGTTLIPAKVVEENPDAFLDIPTGVVFEEVHDEIRARVVRRTGLVDSEVLIKKFTSKLLKIKFLANGDGTLECVGYRTFQCLGQVGRKYPRDLTVKGQIGVDKWDVKHSNEFDVDMTWAILIWGQRGIFIHGWTGEATRASYGNDTNGCLHLRSDAGHNDAKAVYDWIDGRTRVLISYPW